MRVLIANAAGENEQVAERGEGALIGIRALRANSKRSATVVAITYVTCLRLTANDILRFATENAELAERLQQTGLLTQPSKIESKLGIHRNKLKHKD